MDEYSNIYMCLTFSSISLIYNVCEKHIFHGDLVKWIEGFQKEKFCKYYTYIYIYIYVCMYKIHCQVVHICNNIFVNHYI